ncbi:TIP41-like protein [Nasonia vitripennis]|uniref:TIP41-like protein n=1 Tax=Nasonia vitripennis TaxID=7425 RepID=A0A7M7H2U2_NASVI|nr:TIP41-like protein [Nasonia vitripennis]XP_008203420.1 TIP41-like protein [Nasonia vitripennis]
MTTVKYQGGIDILRLPVSEEEHVHPPWYFKYTQSHILHSKCSITGQEDKGCKDDKSACQFCTYSRALEMPHMPDMVFPNNVLHLKHKNGAFLEFRALNALQRVSNGKINIQLACAEAWRESRAESKEYMKETIKPFDWTFTTDYMGTMSGFEVEDTEERIDVEKLKRKDKILFYVDLTLFEDELHDNGIASLSVKMRVMPGTLYILLRYFLRIDNVMLRVNDTRIYHEFGKDYLIREYTSREAKVEDIKVSSALFVLPNEIAPHLPLVKSYYHKLKILPKVESSIKNTTVSETAITTTTTTTTSENSAKDSTAGSSVQSFGTPTNTEEK